MKETTKIVLKVLSNAYLKVQKHYKIYRTMFRAANPYIKYKYNIADCSIMAKGRSIPVRVFRPREYKSDCVLIFFPRGRLGCRGYQFLYESMRQYGRNKRPLRWCP